MKPKLLPVFVIRYICTSANPSCILISMLIPHPASLLSVEELRSLPALIASLESNSFGCQNENEKSFQISGSDEVGQSINHCDYHVSNPE